MSFFLFILANLREGIPFTSKIQPVWGLFIFERTPILFAPVSRSDNDLLKKILSAYYVSGEMLVLERQK